MKIVDRLFKLALGTISGHLPIRTIESTTEKKEES